MTLPTFVDGGTLLPKELNALRNIVSGKYEHANGLLALEGAIGENFVITGLAISERGAGVNMSVDVAVGGAYANDTFTNVTSTENVAIDASDVADDRIDLVTIDSTGTIAITKGINYDPATEAIVPPATPANKTLLAYVFVEHGATTIENGDITDARVYNKNWRLVHYDTNAEGSTPTSESFSYEAYMATKELLVLSTCYSAIGGSASDWSVDRRGYIHTFTIKVDAGVAIKTSTHTSASRQESSDGDTGGDSFINFPMNCRLTSSDMTLTADHTITIAGTSAVASYAYSHNVTDNLCISSLIVLAR